MNADLYITITIVREDAEALRAEINGMDTEGRPALSELYGVLTEALDPVPF